MRRDNKMSGLGDGRPEVGTSGEILTAYPMPTMTELVGEPTHDHRPDCRRCAIILAFEHVGPRPDGTSVDTYVNAVLEVAGWIIGVEL